MIIVSLSYNFIGFVYGHYIQRSTSARVMHANERVVCPIKTTNWLMYGRSVCLFFAFGRPTSESLNEILKCVH